MKKILNNIVLLVSLLLSGCTIKDRGLTKKNTNSPAVANPVESPSIAITTTCNSEQQECNPIPLGVGVKNFRQLIESFVVVTGIVPNAAITEAQTRLQSRLSLDGNALNVPASLMLAVDELASLFCDVRLTSDFALTDINARVLLQGLNLTTVSLPSALDVNVQNRVINNSFDRFLQRSPSISERQAMMNLFSGAIMSQAANSTTTRNALRLVCTAVLGSTDFLLN